jgi:hypothetical protein
MRRYLLVLALFVLFALPAQSTMALSIPLSKSWVSIVRLCADGFIVSVGGLLNSTTTTVIKATSASLPSELGTVFAATGPNVFFSSRVFRWQDFREVGTPVQITLDRFENGRSLTRGAGFAAGGEIENCVLFAENAPRLVNPFIITNHNDSPYCGTYRVQGGDTLGVIAYRHLLTTRTLANTNNIPNANFIVSGTRLQIPCV